MLLLRVPQLFVPAPEKADKADNSRRLEVRVLFSHSNMKHGVHTEPTDTRETEPRVLWVAGTMGMVVLDKIMFFAQYIVFIPSEPRTTAVSTHKSVWVVDGRLATAPPALPLRG